MAIRKSYAWDHKEVLPGFHVKYESRDDSLLACKVVKMSRDTHGDQDKPREGVFRDFPVAMRESH